MSTSERDEWESQTTPRSRSKIEVLLFDADPRVREGFAALVAPAGIRVTATDNRDDVLSWVREVTFAAAVIDLDTPTPGAGFELLSLLSEASPATQLLALANEQTFALAVEAVRLGARDIIAKTPGSVTYLTETVIRLCEEVAQRSQWQALASESLTLLEELLRTFVEASRRAARAEDTAIGGAADEAPECLVLVVDDDPATAQGIKQGLASEPGYRVVGVQNGGEALDYAGRAGYQLALVRDGLPDLPSSIVAKSLRAETDEGIVLLFSHPVDERPGQASIIEASRSIELIPELRTGEELIQQLHELRRALAAKSRERRYLQTFRRENHELLRRYADLRRHLVAYLQSQIAG